MLQEYFKKVLVGIGLGVGLFFGSPIRKMSHSSISMHNNDSPSAASSSNRDPAGEVTRESILQMIKNRTSIDDQINALGGILESVRLI